MGGAVRYVETYTTQDKSDWGDGPWQSEPDKAVWVDEATGLDCMIVRNRRGALCGYVGVGPDHPTHGKDYHECRDVRVHGGLTFAGGCAESGDPSKFVCHIPQPGRPDKVWWFGFDCAHAYDESPGMRASDRKRYEEAKANGDAEGMRIWGYEDPDKSYCSLPYVESQVERLARQFVGVAA